MSNSGLQVIERLVARFRASESQYMDPAFKERWACEEFIEPMLGALGWRRASRADLVLDGFLSEDPRRVLGAVRSPDYGAYVGGRLCFFLEAKKPAIKVHTDKSPALQLRRYGWSARTNLSILTDFEELAIYDCRSQPAESDRASVGRLDYFRYEDYLERWDHIAGLFSREAVEAGSLETWAEVNRSRRPTIPVDVMILREIDAWRTQLAADIHARNPGLGARELTSAVQLLLDRILFLRICEARKIEPERDLADAVAEPAAYERLRGLFERADSRYNSGLFHFRRERGRSGEPDSLTPHLVVGDEVLRAIVTRLYPPKSPYEFSAIPAHVLGSVYEQFLGQQISVRAGSVVVESKPAVKKAGGVVYTPQQVVQYMVDRALRELVAQRSPKTASGETTRSSPIRILDPACGSGSFLIEVYDFLLRWYLREYSARPGTWSRGTNARIVQVAGEWRLTPRERKRILITHVFGVDIDPQAVEVTKLSLLLKVLEGEDEASVSRQLQLFSERALPDLDANIRCGNSLVGTDFAKVDLRLFVDTDRLLSVNPFDWQSEFPDVFVHGGFDAVLGNPPYVVLQGWLRDDLQLEYFRRSYEVASYKLDTYHLFMERAISLTREGGTVCLITPSNYLTNNHLEGLRRYLLDRGRLEEVVVLDEGVFLARSVDTCITVFRPGKPSSEPIEIRHAERAFAGLQPEVRASLNPVSVRASSGALLTGGGTLLADVWRHFDDIGTPLGELCYVNFGKQLRDRKQFKRDVITLDGNEDPPPGYVRCYTGSDVRRWKVEWNGLALRNSDVARRGGTWDAQRHDAVDKLLTKQIGKYPTFGIDRKGYHCLNTIFMVSPRETASACDPLYLLGLLNSTLMRGYWVEHYWDRRRTFPKIKGTFLKQLPIPSPHRHVEAASEIRTCAELLSQPAATGGRATEMQARARASLEVRLDQAVAELVGVDEDAVASAARLLI